MRVVFEEDDLSVLERIVARGMLRALKTAAKAGWFGALGQAAAVGTRLPLAAADSVPTPAAPIEAPLNGHAAVPIETPQPEMPPLPEVSAAPPPEPPRKPGWVSLNTVRDHAPEFGRMIFDARPDRPPVDTQPVEVRRLPEARPGRPVAPPPPRTERQRAPSTSLRQVCRTVAHRPEGFIDSAKARELLGDLTYDPLGIWIRAGEIDAVIVAGAKPPTKGLPGRLYVSRRSLMEREAWRVKNSVPGVARMPYPKREGMAAE